MSNPRSIVIVDEELPLLVSEYKFNETGTSNCPSTGWETMPVLLCTSNDVATDLHGASGSGASGALADRAFDNTASSVMGTNGIGGYARQTNDCNSLDSFSSFTLSGWFKTASTDPIRDYARLADKYSGTSGYALVGGTGTPGRIAFSADSASTLTTTGPNWSNTQIWVFFAVTYDGTKTASNVNFYRGYRSSDDVGGASPVVTPIETLTANSGRIDDSTYALYLGNRQQKDRPLDGYLDNIRIHGVHAPNDPRGALSLSALEAIRFADTDGPPGITTEAATGVGTTGATLNGYLTAAGATPAYVTVYWGRTDGGTNATQCSPWTATVFRCLPCKMLHALSAGIVVLAAFSWPKNGL